MGELSMLPGRVELRIGVHACLYARVHVSEILSNAVLVQSINLALWLNTELIQLSFDNFLLVTNLVP